jgi:hypothetical protein
MLRCTFVGCVTTDGRASLRGGRFGTAGCPDAAGAEEAAAEEAAAEEAAAEEAEADADFA